MEVPVTQDDSLLALLACPKCHGSLRRVAEPAPRDGVTEPNPQALGCERCRLLYALDDGLPNMLVEDAKPWPEQRAGGIQA